MTSNKNLSTVRICAETIHIKVIYRLKENLCTFDSQMIIQTLQNNDRL